VDVISDRQRVFEELLAAQRELAALNQAGREMGLVDGTTSDVDEVMARLHGAQHRLDALAAEAVQAALAVRRG
jgi:hypothetical protein